VLWVLAYDVNAFLRLDAIGLTISNGKYCVQLCVLFVYEHKLCLITEAVPACATGRTALAVWRQRGVAWKCIRAASRFLTCYCVHPRSVATAILDMDRWFIQPGGCGLHVIGSLPTLVVSDWSEMESEELISLISLALVHCSAWLWIKTRFISWSVILAHLAVTCTDCNLDYSIVL